MKKTLIVLALMLPLITFAQVEPKPARLDYESGFWANYFTLDNKKQSNTDVQLHLKKYSPDALNHYKAGNAYAYTGLGFSIGGLGGAAWYLSESLKKPTTLTAINDNSKKKGAALAITGLLVAFGLVFVLAADKQYQKTKKTYNKQYGY